MRLRYLDLACCCVFATEWLFWLWLAPLRIRYIASLQSLLDIVTIGPILVSVFVNSHVSDASTAGSLAPMRTA